MNRLVALLAVAAAVASSARAETHVVNPDGTGDFPTIQAAVDASEHGDIIELANGVFAGAGNWNVDFLGKAITIRSQSGDPEDARIECDLSRAFIFQTDEGPASVLEGITIAQGYDGSVVCREGTAPTVRDCVFEDNLTEGQGGGLVCRGASPAVTGCFFNACFAFGSGGAMFCDGGSHLTVSGCVFENNIAAYSGSGGAISCPDGLAEITNSVFVGNRAEAGSGGAIRGNVAIADCEFVGNSARFGGAVRSDSAEVVRCVFLFNSAENEGGAILCGADGVAVLENCTLYESNAAWPGSGIYARDGSSVNMERCIVAFGTGGRSVECGSDAVIELTCCDVYGNEGGDWVGCTADKLGQDGNICEDPLFCSLESCPPDLRLQDISPCAPFSPPNPGCDLIGALAVACEGTPTTRSTWGNLKLMFRE